MPAQLDTPYYGDERLVIAIDVGNSFSSVSITHLQFGQKPAVRTVNRYPGGLSSSRTPSAIAYDLKENPKAFGAETSQPAVVARGKAESWVMVREFKSQMLPPPVEESGSGKLKKKLLKKKSTTPAPAPPPERTLLGVGNGNPASASSLSINNLVPGNTSSGFPLLNRSLTPDRLVDGLDSGTTAAESADWVIPHQEAKGRNMRAYEGPVLKLIYSDHIKHLVACARAWFGDATPDGEAVFMRLWQTCTFVLPHPADWGPAETDTLRDAMHLARLIPTDSDLLRDRLVFLKEPAATVYFARRHVSAKDANWINSQEPFALCDSAEVGTSIIGYRIVSLQPLIKLQPYDPLSRLPVGASSVTRAFQTFITKKLHKSKFKSAEHIAIAMDLFETRIKGKFAASGETFTMRLATEGSDSGAKVKDGLLTLTGGEIEDVFLPTVGAIVARLSAVVSLGEAKSIILAGGFGESPYLQRRLRDTFEPRGVAVIVPEIPTHNAISEGAARFYLSHTIRPRPLKFDLGVSTSVDWSSNWQKGMDREIFTSVSGKRFILGKWTAVVPKGTIFDPLVTISKMYNVKYVLASQDPVVRIDLWAHDPDSEPKAEGWMTNLEGKPLPNFEKVCTVEADLASLVALQPVRGQSLTEDETKWWAQLEFELVVYVGSASLEACLVWKENDEERRGPPSVIRNGFF